MRKRLRKKRHLAEFTVYGFELEFDLKPLSREQHNEFVDRFLAEAIEANDLQFGGGGPADHWGGFVVHERGSTTEAHMNAVRQWLRSQDSVTDIRVGPLRDAYYGWD